MKKAALGESQTIDRLYGEMIMFAGGTNLRTVQGDLRLLKIDAGKSTSLHYHEKSESIFHVVVGLLSMEVNGEPVDLCAGDTIVIEPGELHVLRNVGDRTAKVLETMAPPYSSKDIFRKEDTTSPTESLSAQVKRTTQFERAVAVCGQIGSGKSTVIATLSNAYGWDSISFSTYVRELATLRGLSASREELQKLGQELVESKSTVDFMTDAIYHFAPLSSVHLIDGIRHPRGVAALRTLYRNSTIIYLSLPNDIRFQRFAARMRAGDPTTDFEGFMKLSQAEIESEIQSIQAIADHVVDSAGSVEETLGAIITVLQQQGFLHSHK